MDDLGKHANCSNSTIRDYEAGRRLPHQNRLAAIRQALEMAGIVFTGADGDTMVGIAGKATPGDKPRADVIEKAPASRKRKPGGGRKRA